MVGGRSNRLGCSEEIDTQHTFFVFIWAFYLCFVFLFVFYLCSVFYLQFIYVFLFVFCVLFVCFFIFVFYLWFVCVVCLCCCFICVLFVPHFWMVHVESMVFFITPCYPPPPQGVASPAQPCWGQCRTAAGAPTRTTSSCGSSRTWPAPTLN